MSNSTIKDEAKIEYEVSPTTPTPIGSNLTIVTVTIRGTRPLWQHQFGPDALPLTPREKTGVAGNDPDEWRRTCMIDRNGRPYLHSTYLFAVVRGGGRYIKKGRSNIMTSIAATLQIMEDPIFIHNRFWPGYETINKRDFNPKTAVAPPQDPTQPLYLDVRGVRNPSTKARNIRYRIALAPGWETTFTIQFDRSIVSRTQMHSAIIQAGELVGIGNGRTIGMGRFEVITFTQLTTANSDLPQTADPANGR